MRLGTAALILPLFLVGCTASQPDALPPPPPLPSRAAFTEAVLTPLAKELAVNILDQWKDEARAEKANYLTLLHVVQRALSLGGKVGATLGGVLTAVPAQQLTEFEARLDILKAPLTARLLGLYEGRIVDKGDFFSVCMQGKKKRWARAVGFPRLDDGEGACSKTMVSLADLNTGHLY